MAKKKTAETANIKAAPVLRADDGGGQDTSKTKSYCIRDDWKDINKVNYVAFKSVDGDVQDLTVNGEPAGGGGGSTATVQITVNTGRGVDVLGPVISNNIIMTDRHDNQLWHIDLGASDTFTVPLASGGMQLFVGGIPGGTNPVITGGGTWDADNGCFIITSNCTITI